MKAIDSFQLKDTYQTPFKHGTHGSGRRFLAGTICMGNFGCTFTHVGIGYALQTQPGHPSGIVSGVTTKIERTWMGDVSMTYDDPSCSPSSLTVRIPRELIVLRPEDQTLYTRIVSIQALGFAMACVYTVTQVVQCFTAAWKK